MPIVPAATGLEATAHILQVDPTVTGFRAVTGAFAYSMLTAKLYVKYGEENADWTPVDPGSTGETLLAATVSALSAVSVTGYPNGQPALVTTVAFFGSATYTLVPAMGTADSLNLVATADDAARQWVRKPIVDGANTPWPVLVPNVAAEPRRTTRSFRPCPATTSSAPCRG